MSGVKRAAARKKSPQTNIRRKKFVKNLVSGMGVGQAALRAGYADKTEGSHLLKEPSVLTALQTAMEKAGITDDYLATKIHEGLNAVYPEKLTKDGRVLSPAAPDFFVRGQYIDKVFKVRGDYAPDRHIEEKKVLTINVTMDTLKGLKDCGVLEAEILDVGNEENGGRPALPAGGVRPDRPDREGPQEEDCGERCGFGEDASDAQQADEQGGVTEAGQCGEGPGEAGTPQAGPPGTDVSAIGEQHG